MMLLDTNDVITVAAWLAGKRREKFMASVGVLDASLAQGGWVKGGSRKASTGFYQGIVKVPYHSGGSSERFELSQCLSYGHRLDTDITPSDELIAMVAPKLPISVARAWIALCRQASAAIKALDAARPLPTITPIGLSPKVTKTLTECSLDLELPSIRLAKIAFYERPLVVTTKDGAVYCAIDTKTGQRVLEKVYYPDWTPGIKHHMSRFVSASGCEACGKHIPSGRFVPIEAMCKRNGLVSMWLGCDCARNIFGIKDVGVNRS